MAIDIATTMPSSNQSTSTLPKLTPLQQKMQAKLTSARFRHLNQTLYTSSSSSALQLFQSDPSLFTSYHAGFSQQVATSWPQNPVTNYIEEIKARSLLPPSNPSALTRRPKTGSCTIADLGCGDAPLARALATFQTQNHKKLRANGLKLTIHSYDLHASNSYVTVADIAKLPLRDGEADIAIFCLSLMGTNWISFVEEAWRVLRGDGRGEVWVAEVKSRFGRAGQGKRAKGEAVENSVGKRRKNQKVKGKAGKDEDEDEVVLPSNIIEENTGNVDHEPDSTDITPFVDVFSRRGFVLKPETVNKKNKMFASMVFVKSGVPVAGKHKGMKWNGSEYQRLNDSKLKAVTGLRDDPDDIDPLQEAKVLKPCVYKTR